MTSWDPIPGIGISPHSDFWRIVLGACSKLGSASPLWPEPDVPHKGALLPRTKWVPLHWKTRNSPGKYGLGMDFLYLAKYSEKLIFAFTAFYPFFAPDSGEIFIIPLFKSEVWSWPHFPACSASFLTFGSQLFPANPIFSLLYPQTLCFLCSVWVLWFSSAATELINI